MMSRFSPPIRRLASVTAALLLVSGCAQQHVEIDPAPVRRPAPPIAARPGRPGFVVAAPQAAGNAQADVMAEEIARRTGFGLVVAGGDSRPESYEQRVLDAARGPLRFYAEIHDAARTECAGRIEIATVGVDRELALRLRMLAELIRDAHLRSNREIQRLDVLVEPADPVGARARRDGVLRFPDRALQIELPRCARRDWRQTYAAILAEFLAQAVTLPVGR